LDKNIFQEEEENHLLIPYSGIRRNQRATPGPEKKQQIHQLIEKFSFPTQATRGRTCVVYQDVQREAHGFDLLSSCLDARSVVHVELKSLELACLCENVPQFTGRTWVTASGQDLRETKE
jgi:hypothetical protein